MPRPGAGRDAVCITPSIHTPGLSAMNSTSYVSSRHASSESAPQGLPVLGRPSRDSTSGSRYMVGVSERAAFVDVIGVE